MNKKTVSKKNEKKTKSKKTKAGKEGVMKKNKDSEIKKILPKSKKLMPDEKYVRKGIKKITQENVDKVLGRQKEIENKFKGPLRKFFDDVRILFQLLKDYKNGVYTEIPWFTIAAATFALLYVLIPTDAIPDPIPVIGLLDDAAVVAICIMLIREDLEKYKAWKLMNT